MPMRKFTSQIIHRDFEFAYNPPLSLKDGSFITHQTYKVTAIVSIETVLTPLNDGIESKIQANAVIAEIHDYADNDTLGNVVSLCTIADRHGTPPMFSAEDRIRLEIVNSVLDVALDKSFKRKTMAQYLSDRPSY